MANVSAAERVLPPGKVNDMPDVSRALLLPDVQAPSDGMLKTLALYWHEIVVPDYAERLGVCCRETGEPTRTPSFAALEKEGVVVAAPRFAELPPAPTDPSHLVGSAQNLAEALGGGGARCMSRALRPIFKLPPAPADLSPLIVCGQNLTDVLVEDGIGRVLDALRPIIEACSEVDCDEAPPARGVPCEEDLAPAVLDAVQNLSREATSLYLNRLQDAFELARKHSLAPVAHSVASHVGSLVGDYSDDVPRREAALLSAAVDAFEIHDETTVEDILLFRTRHGALVGRFRASLVDLAAELQRDAAPLALLASARDTYRNRVEPALGDLEAAMNESRLRFLIRSLLGATAITLAPVKPIRAVEAGASLVGNTVTYRFSREKLLREHPFGLLHKIAAEFSTHQGRGRTELEFAIQDPEHFLVSVLSHPRLYRQLLGEFWTSRDAATSSFARILDALPLSAKPGTLAPTPDRDARRAAA
jgi:hypothetical protein